MRILLVEDDPHAAQVLAKGLREQAYAVDLAKDGHAAIVHSGINDYDGIILDVMLPVADGLTVCRAIRAAGSAVPILMLTARDTVEARVNGLDAGADDYLVKPFDLDELSARVRAVARRRAGRAESVVRIGELEIDAAARVVRWKGAEVGLSPREYALLEALANRPGAYLTRAQLEERLYGWDEEIASNAVEVHIHALRRKLDPELIRNVRGMGYTIAKAH